MNDFAFNYTAFFNSILYTMVGVMVFWLASWLFERLTPAYDLWKELIEKQNVALAILVGCMCLGLAIIIAAAIHG